MSSLFGHLVTRFSPGAENLATEALAYILGRSPAARRALNHVSGSLCPQLPEVRSFKTQFSGEDRSIPDLAGFDAAGRPVVLIENKFWAGLTSNQPAAYLERLPKDGPGLLLFVVPPRRLHTMWPDLVTSAAGAGLQLPSVSSYDGNMVWGQVGRRTLAVTSWQPLLDRIEAEARAAGEAAILSDAAQLRGLCEQMDATGYVPATLEELTNTEVPRRLIAVADLIPELCDRAIAAGVAYGKGLRPTHFWHGAGRYIQIGGAGGWLGLEHRFWAKYGIGPLWITFGASVWGRGTAVLNAVAPWLSSNPVRAFDADGAAVIPLRITPYVTKDVVLADLFTQLVELQGLLKSVQGVVGAVPPEPVEAPA